MGLEDVLDDKEPEAPKEDVVETPEAPPEKPTSKRKDFQAKEWAAQGRDPVTGQYIPKEELKVEVKPEEKVEVKAEKPDAPKQDFTERERAFLRAAEEERRKRQEFERQIAELKKPQAEAKSFWDDPEGHLKAFEQKFAEKETNIRLGTAEAIARAKYKDFDQNVEEFAMQLQQTPGLHAQWLASPDPAEFAYRFGERTKLLREAGSIDNLKAKIEKETRAKLEAEFKAKQEELEKQRAALPGSLSDVRGTSTRQQPVYTGPTPLEDILKG